MRVAELGLGRVVTESDIDSSLVTTITSDPEGEGGRVRLESRFPTSKGIASLFERLLLPTGQRLGLPRRVQAPGLLRGARGGQRQPSVTSIASTLHSETWRGVSSFGRLFPLAVSSSNHGRGKQRDQPVHHRHAGLGTAPLARRRAYTPAGTSASDSPTRMVRLPRLLLNVTSISAPLACDVIATPLGSKMTGGAMSHS